MSDQREREREREGLAWTRVVQTEEEKKTESILTEDNRRFDIFLKRIDESQSFIQMFCESHRQLHCFPNLYNQEKRERDTHNTPKQVVLLFVLKGCL